MSGVFLAELRKEFLLARSYAVELVADQLFFGLGFLLVTGVLETATAGRYSPADTLASLIGWLTWRAAAGCMADTTDSLADDAQWGTLEQVWLCGRNPGLLLVARGATAALYYTARVLLLAAVLLPLLRLPLLIQPGAIPVYLLTLAGAFGLAFALAGLHLVYQNVAGLTFALATLLLFLSGAIASLEGIPILYPLSRLLPLAGGLDLLRALLVEGVPPGAALTGPAAGGLLVNSAVYLGLGLAVLAWGTRRAAAKGTLAHY